MKAIIYKDESFDIIGTCFEVHNNLGSGFLEIVYKDALENEFRKNNIPFVHSWQIPHEFMAK